MHRTGIDPNWQSVCVESGVSHAVKLIGSPTTIKPPPLQLVPSNLHGLVLISTLDTEVSSGQQAFSLHACACVCLRAVLGRR